MYYINCNLIRCDYKLYASYITNGKNWGRKTIYKPTALPNRPIMAYYFLQKHILHVSSAVKNHLPTGMYGNTTVSNKYYNSR
jgi:hypothetical protein